MKTKNTYAVSHAEPSTFSTAVLQGLGVDRWSIIKIAKTKGQRGKHFLVPQERHVYGGTVPFETIQRRRAANRAARKSRRINRMRSK